MTSSLARSGLALCLACVISATASTARADAPPEDAPGEPAPTVESAPPPPPQGPPPQALQPQGPPPQLVPASPPEPQITYVTQRRWNLFALGCGIFGGAWIGDMVLALNNGLYEGMIPIAGPFLVIGSIQGTGNQVLLGLDGAAQAGGLVVAILGLALTKKVPMYAVVPTGNGLAVAGRF